MLLHHTLDAGSMRFSWATFPQRLRWTQCQHFVAWLTLSCENVRYSNCNDYFSEFERILLFQAQRLKKTLTHFFCAVKQAWNWIATSYVCQHYMNSMPRLLWTTVVVSALSFTRACNIWGHDTGYCSELPLDPLWRMENLPWCQYAVLYPACLPKEQVPIIITQFVWIFLRWI